MRRYGWLALLSAVALAGTPISFRTRELPRAVFGVAYHARLSVRADPRCPSADVVLGLAGGQLPRGIEVSGDELAGVPKEFGLFHIRLRAATECAVAVEDFTLEVTGKPILRVTPASLVFEMREGEAPPKPQTLLVSATWDDLAYSMQAAGAPWLALRMNRGATPYGGSSYAADPVTVEISTGGLLPGTYYTAVHVWADEGSNAPEIPITLRVLPK